MYSLQAEGADYDSSDDNDIINVHIHIRVCIGLECNVLLSTFNSYMGRGRREREAGETGFDDILFFERAT